MAYPLKQLAQLREHRQSEAEVTLSDALEAVERAADALDDALEARAEHREAEAERRREARAAMVRCTAGALAREERYRERQLAEDAALTRAVDRRRGRLESARACAAAAREALGDAIVERRVVERHRERWAQARALEAERRVDREL